MIVRRRMRRLSLVLVPLFMVAIVGASVSGQKNPGKSTNDLASDIDPEKIRAHVKFLASDLLEVRGTGQRGGDIAAEYIATQFELYCLKPSFPNGSYFQDVPMMGVKIAAIGERRLEAVEFELRGDIFRRNVAAALPRSAPFEQIAGEKFHVSADFLGIRRFNREACQSRGCVRLLLGGKGRAKKSRH